MERSSVIWNGNARLARSIWGRLPSLTMGVLKQLTQRFVLSVAEGDLLLLEGKWYVTHAGLLRIARRNRCYGIRTAINKELSDPAAERWVVRATVYKSPRSCGFTGIGDANPGNISSLARGAELRIAESRAIDRAIRAAYAVGICSVEELGWAPKSNPSGSSDFRKAPTNGNNGQQNGQPRLRDRLSLLIRQHQLDAGLVKAFAADYCGTATLRDASREQIESFVNDLAVRATKDRDGLVCQLNAYSISQEVTS